MNPELTAKDIDEHDTDLFGLALWEPEAAEEYGELRSNETRAKMVGRFVRTFGGDK